MEMHHGKGMKQQQDQEIEAVGDSFADTFNNYHDMNTYHLMLERLHALKWEHNTRQYAVFV